MKRTYENELENCRVLIYGVRNNDPIKQRISAIYNEDRLANGDDLFQAAKIANEAIVIEKAESLAANRAFNDVRESIHKGMVAVRKAVRYFFKKDLRVIDLVQTNAEIPSSFGEWKSMAELTFNAVQREAVIQEKLTLAELKPEKIQGFKQQLGEIDNLRIKAEKEDGEAQLATQTRVAALNNLKKYCSDLRECLDLFYKGTERQKLEEVGIVVK